MKLFGRKRFAEIAIGASIEKTLAILSHDVVARLPQKHGCEQSVYRVVLGVQRVAV